MPPGELLILVGGLGLLAMAAWLLSARLARGDVDVVELLARAGEERDAGDVARDEELQARRVARALVRGCRPLRVRRLPPGATLADVALDGTLPSGRAASIRFEGSPPRARLAVHAVAAPRLRVERETVATRLAKSLGRVRELVVGDRDFDERYLLLTEDVRAARRALRAEELRAAIDRVMSSHAVERVELDGDDLVATVDARTMKTAAYARLLRTLDLVADVLQRQRVPVKLLGGERAAVVDPGGTMRCVFCLDAVVADDARLTACTACRTVVHDACWTEHGGCPVYGCRGGERERARA